MNKVSATGGAAPPVSQFGQRLREAFGGARNIEIARKLGVTGGAVKHYIEGRVPSAETLIVIARLTKCSLHWLLTGEGEKYAGAAVPQKLQSEPFSFDRAFDDLVNYKIAPVVRDLEELKADLNGLAHALKALAETLDNDK